MKGASTECPSSTSPNALLSTAQSWSISSRFSSARAAKRASSAASWISWLCCHWLSLVVIVFSLKCRDQLLRNGGKQTKNTCTAGAAGHFFECLGIWFCTCEQNNSLATLNHLIASLLWTSSICSKWNSEPIKSCNASKAPNDCLSVYIYIYYRLYIAFLQEIASLISLVLKGFVLFNLEK